MLKHKIQVSPQIYHNGYDDLRRFISYYYQINTVRNLNPKNVLEIWVGNKTVSDYLRKLWYEIDTCDFDSDLKPDYVADVCDLPFSNNSYDVVIICQVLEHLPFEDLETALKQLARVSNKYVIVSLPYSSLNFEFIFRLPILNRLMNRVYFSRLFRIPYFYREHQFDWNHYWEIGKKWFSISRIRGILDKYFITKDEFTPILNPYHHFFILETKNNK